MYWKYLLKTITRNKVRTFLVAVGIIVSVTMITGINIASNQMSTYQIVTQINKVKNDFSFVSYGFESGGGIPSSYSQDMASLNDLEDDIDEYLMTYASNFYEEYEMLLQASSEELNWTELLNQDYFEQKKSIDRGYIYEFSHSIFIDNGTNNRFQDLVISNETLDFSLEGIFLDLQTATQKNISVGENITIGFLEQVYDDQQDRIYNFTVQYENITVLGLFDVLDTTEFMNAFGGYYWDEMPMMMMGNMEYLDTEILQPLYEELEEKIGNSGLNNHINRESQFKYHVLIDHTAIAQTNPDTIQNDIEYIETFVEKALVSNTFYFESNLINTISMVKIQISLFQGAFIIISVPVLVLGWYLCKTNWILSYQRRRREMALLKTRGGYQQQLKSMFRAEALIIGILGGLTGVIGGNLTAFLVLKQVYPEAANFFAGSNLFDYLFTGQYMTISTWTVGLIIGITMSFFAVKKPLKEFAQLDPIEGMQKYSEEHHNALAKKKSETFFLISGAVPILNALILQGFIKINQDFYYNPFISLINTLSTLLLPFAPFMLIYAIIRIVCRNRKIFEFLVKKISLIYRKQISIFTQKSIIRNQARSFRLVFLIAMALSFMVMATSIEGIETEYQNQLQILETGNGKPISVEFWGSENVNITPIFDFIDTNKNMYSIQNYTYAYKFEQSKITSPNAEYTNSLVAIDAEGFKNLIPLRDKWFANTDAEELLSDLQLTPNTTIIPRSFANKGYYVGENITAEYYNQETENQVEIRLEIIGIYDVIPLGYSQWSWEDPALMNIENLNTSEAQVENIIFSFYDNPNDNITLSSDRIISGINSIEDITCYAYKSSGVFGNEILTLFTSSLLRYLNLQSFYLLTIVSFGVGIIMYISINEKSRDLSLLRARAVPKSVIYKIQLAEGFTLLIMSTLFIGLGLLGGAAMILQLNNLTSLIGTGFQRSLIFPWGKIALQVVGSIFLFMVSIGIAVSIETKKSDISNITDILRVSA